MNFTITFKHLLVLRHVQDYGFVFVSAKRKALCPWLGVGLRVKWEGTMFLLIFSKAKFIGYHLQGGGVWGCGQAKERLLIKQSSLSTCGQRSSSPTLLLQDEHGIIEAFLEAHAGLN